MRAERESERGVRPGGTREDEAWVGVRAEDRALMARMQGGDEAAQDVAEDALAREARHRGLDGVVCGHIQKAEIRDVGGILYCNDGDWVESLTALVEDAAGNLSILHWHEVLAATTAIDDESPTDALVPEPEPSFAVRP